MKEKIETIQQLDKRKIFEQIKTPQELLDFMGRNIEYGFVSSKDKKKYSWKDKEMDEKFEEEYFLQSPTELIESGYGVCWDSAELEREWFARHGYNFRVYFIMFAKDDPNDSPTHTFLVYKVDDKWYWFEHSDGGNRGIHEYNSLEDLLSAAKERHFQHAESDRGARPEDRNSIVIKDFNKPRFGCKSQEFVDQVFADKDKVLDKSGM